VKPNLQFPRTSSLRGAQEQKNTSVYPKVSGLSHNEINNNNKYSLRSNTKGYGGKTHRIAIKLHLVADSCIIFSSRSMRPVRKFWIHPRIYFTVIWL